MEYLKTLESTLDGILVSNQDGVIEFCNQTMNTMFGYADNELEGQSVEVLMGELFRQAHVTQRSDYMAIAEPQSRFMNQGKRFMAMRKDGAEFPVSISLNPITMDGKRYISALIQDMTKMEEYAVKLEQSQKLEALGEMVGGIAHNFNNSIAGISGQAYLLNKHESLSVKGVARIESINTLCTQASDIIKQLLIYARQQKEEFCDFMLANMTKEVIEIIKVTAPPRIEIQFEMEDTDFQLYGMKSQIQQTLLNVCNNAFHAIGDSEGVVSISIMRCASSSCTRKLCALTHNDAASFVCIKIEDTGDGIAESHLHRVFDPFFSTKPVGQGTGLGLSTAYGIIKKHGGDIYVHSKPGEGTVFQIYLPIAENKAQASTTPSALTQAETSNAESAPIITNKALSILIIDDDPALCNVFSNVLNELGYSTFTASNGQQGVDLFTRHQDDIDLVLSDIAMPKLNGCEVLSKIRAMQPNLPFIFISGYQGASFDASVLCDNTKHMSKPFDYIKLSQMMNEMVACLA